MPLHCTCGIFAAQVLVGVWPVHLAWPCDGTSSFLKTQLFSIQLGLQADPIHSEAPKRKMFVFDLFVLCTHGTSCESHDPLTALGTRKSLQGPSIWNGTTWKDRFSKEAHKI